MADFPTIPGYSNLPNTIADQFKNWVGGEISSTLSILSFMQSLSSSSSSNVSTKNIKEISAKTKTALSSKGVEATDDELEPILYEILRSIFSTQASESSVEETFEKIIEVIGVKLILNKDSIYYIAQLIARRLIALLTFEISMLNYIKKNYDDLGTGLNDISTQWQMSGNVYGDRVTTKVNYSTFYSNQLAEAEGQIDKVSDAVLRGSLNPTSLSKYNSIIDNLFSDKNIEKFNKGYSSSDYAIKSILTRMAYVESIHTQIIDMISNWGSLIKNYNELQLPAQISKGVLNNINTKIGYWKTYFSSIDTKAKFERLREFLLFLSASQETVNSIFDAEDYKATIINTGTIPWKSSGSSGLMTLTANPWPNQNLNNMRVSFNSATLDENDLVVPYHEIVGYTNQIINFSPGIAAPPSGSTLYYALGHGGSDYSLKYEALKLYMASIDLPKSLKLLEFSSSDPKKDMGASLWSYIDSVNNKTFNIQEYTILKTKSNKAITNITDKLTQLRNALLGYSLPQLSDIDEIDDILEDNHLDVLREYFISGYIKKFFTTPIIGANTQISLMTKINMLMTRV